MDYIIKHKTNERKDKTKSAIITLLVSLVVFLVIYFYNFTHITEKKEEIVTTMLVNFGDDTEGQQTEEPSQEQISSVSEPIMEPQPVENPQPEPQPEPQKPTLTKEKIITGNNTNAKTTKVEAAKKVTEKKAATTPNKTQPKTQPKTEKVSTNKTANTQNTSTQQNKGDAQGTAAVGNLIRGRGANAGTQGNTANTGNSGDPVGGESNGESKIGVDRKLIAFIPGTMGRGGTQPTHNCTSSGTISIAYTVDKAGNVISARRSGGISDPCAVSTTVAWVKQYVKAERGTTSSTGIYRITF